jgi:hypothetical protein
MGPLGRTSFSVCGTMENDNETHKIIVINKLFWRPGIDGRIVVAQNNYSYWRVHDSDEESGIS